MTNEQYHADTSRISKSGLDLISRSPAHYWAKYLDPNRKKRIPTDAMEIGTATHYAILEADKFEEKYYFLNDTKICAEIGGAKPRATNRYKEWLSGVLLENEGRTALEPDEYDQLRYMRDSVHAHPAARELLKQGVQEQTVFFQEEITGVDCKCRPDWLDTANGLIVDLKTTENASPGKFPKSVLNYRYDVQAAFYLDGLSSCMSYDFNANGFVFIAIEKEPPYAVAVYMATNEVLNRGRMEYLSNLERYSECLKTGIWPAYSTKIEKLKLPAWA